MNFNLHFKEFITSIINLEDKLYLAIIDEAINHFKNIPYNLESLKEKFKYNDNHINDKNIDKIFSSTVLLINEIILNHIKEETIERVFDEHKDQCTTYQRTSFINKIKENQIEMEKNRFSCRKHLPYLKNIKCKIDINEGIHHPKIIMKMETNENIENIFYIPENEFHNLRYNVAKVLQHMNELESHPIMRLVYDPSWHDVNS